jgi:hypothetical protein
MGLTGSRSARLSPRRLISLLTVFVAGALACGAYLGQSALASKAGHRTSKALGSGYGGYGGSGYDFSSSRTISAGGATVVHSVRVRETGSGSVTNTVHTGSTTVTHTTHVPAPVTVSNSVTVSTPSH